MSVKEQSRLTAMQLLFLQAINNRPRCRAAIKDVLDDEFGELSKSTFYRLCRWLTDGGYIEKVIRSPTRQQYAITEKGQSATKWFTSATEQIQM